MITLSSAQLDAWIMLLIWPFARILALIAAAPISGSQQFPTTAKIGLAVLLATLVAPTLPAAPPVDPASLAGLLLLARETLLGVGMGLAMRVVFSGVSMAGPAYARPSEGAINRVAMDRKPASEAFP